MPARPLKDVTSAITVEMVARVCRDARVEDIRRHLPSLLHALSAAGLGDRPMVILALAVIQCTARHFTPTEEWTSPGGQPFDRLVATLKNKESELRRALDADELVVARRLLVGGSFGVDEFGAACRRAEGEIDPGLGDRLPPRPSEIVRPLPRPAPSPNFEIFTTADDLPPPRASRGQRSKPPMSGEIAPPSPVPGASPVDVLQALRANTAARINADTVVAAVSPRAAASPPPQPPLKEPLDVSAFAPPAVARSEPALVQVFLHRPEQAEAAAALAKEADAEAAPRGTTTLLVEVAIGQRVDILLEAAGATIDTPVQNLIWRGQPRACQFWLSLADASVVGALAARVMVSVDGAPAGSLRFRLPIADKAPAVAAGLEMKGDAARRYTYAFLSYASPDRAEVLKRAQALKALGVSFFQDLLSLEPGQRWEKRLYEEIDRCDLFLLFWSSHASASKWVVAETERALARHQGKDEAPPDIVPIVLEGPPMPRPPDSLKAIHMNDWLRYVIAAEEAAKPPP